MGVGDRLKVKVEPGSQLHPDPPVQLFGDLLSERVSSELLASSKELGLLSPVEAVGTMNLLPGTLTRGIKGRVALQTASWSKRNSRLETCRIPKHRSIKKGPGLCFVQK